MERFLAFLLGCSLAGVLLALGLRLREPLDFAQIELYVVDVRGEPIEHFGWAVLDETTGSLLGAANGAQDAHPGGVASMPVPVCFPARRLMVEIRATGFLRAKLGPFDPEVLPARLEFVVPDLGLIVGKVTFEGQRIAGAQVMLVHSDGELTAGVPSGLLSGYKQDTATTDASGAFRLGSEFPDRVYYVRAWKQGHAAGIAGPVRVDDPALEVQLHEGGSIEGVLRVDGAHEPDGYEIELYRTEPAPWMFDVYGHFVARAVDDGLFRFEHVDPGPWLVRLHPRESEGGVREQLPPENLPFLVDVAEHETVRLDMDLSQPLAQLRGRMTIEGRPWSATRVFLHATGDLALVLDMARADEEGWWTLRARAPGRYRVLARGGCEHNMQPKPFSDVVELSRQAAPWEHEFTWGPCPGDR